MIEAWLSLVERCVRDAEVASSNLVASTPGPDGQAVKTTPSHGVNPGSIPGQVIDEMAVALQQPFFILRIATVAQLVAQRIRNAWVAGSSPASGLIEKVRIYKEIWRFKQKEKPSDVGGFLDLTNIWLTLTNLLWLKHSPWC